MKTTTNRGRRWLLAMGMLGWLGLGAACGAPAEEPERGCEAPEQRSQCAKAAGGKADGVDWCAEHGWYDDPDGYCDDPGGYCAMPDPDCGPDPDACGDTLASSGWSWDGDASHGCDVEREVLSAALAREGVSLPFRVLDIPLKKEKQEMQLDLDQGVHVFDRFEEATYAIDHEVLAAAAIDFDEEWLAVVYHEPSHSEGGEVLAVDAVRQYTHRIEVEATVHSDVKPCATPGPRQRYAVVAFARPQLPTGERRDAHRLWLTEQHRACPSWPPASSPLSLPAEGDTLTIPGVVPSKISDLTATYRGAIPEAPGGTVWDRLDEGQNVAYSFTAEGGDPIELLGYVGISAKNFYPHKRTPVELWLFGPIEHDGAQAPLPVPRWIERDLAEARFVAPADGTYLAVLRPNNFVEDGAPYTLQLTRRRSEVPSRYTLHESLHLIGRAYAEGNKSVGQSWVDAAVADLDGDGRDDLILLGAGFHDSSGFGEAMSRWITVMEQQPDGTLRTGRSFEHAPPPTNNSTSYRHYVRMAVGDLDADGDSDIAVYGWVSGLRLMRNDGQGGLTLESLTVHGKIAGGQPLYGIAMTDFDGDGRQDLVVNARVLRQQPDGSFVASERLDLQKNWTVGDVTGDGIDDIVSVKKGTDGELVVFPSGLQPAIRYDFHVPSSFSHLTIDRLTVTDLDGDGINELIMSNDGVLWVLRQQEDGTLDMPASFDDLLARGIPYGIPWVIQDGDGDGRADLLASAGLHMRTSLRLAPPDVLEPHSWTGSYSWTTPAADWVDGAMGDLDGDGCSEAVMLARHRNVAVHYGVGCP